jgi:glycosyltransferase involved in cell wall biosynthesis
MSHRASVVIPAHNEERVLARGLSTLLRGTEPGELDVIVVANACTDSTAAVARAHGVRVIETSTPGKAHALRLGDAAASTFPRLYADADIDLTAESVRVLVDTLARPGVLATSPVPHYDLTNARPSARRLHKVHELLMADRRGLAGAGVYCLSEVGHARVAPFPDVISDDGLVHRSFAPGERVVSSGASSVVRPTTTFGASLRRRVRVRQGNQELDALGLPRAEGRLRVGALVGLVRTRRITPVDAGWYLFLLGADRAQVRWRRMRGAEVSWGTDASSRQATAPSVEGG